MRDLYKLLDVVKKLRDPIEGCHWDWRQDFSSIAPYTIEEAYEVADAIAREDLGALKDELGDLLYQVVFHARMAEELGEFDFADVVTGITKKIVRRHPQVFGTEKERATAIPFESWENIKAAERAQKGEDTSALAGVAIAFPALKRALKIGRRAARVGFDWPDHEGVRAKIREEMDELEVAIGKRDFDQVDEEFGDMLFACVNMARHLNIDPEKSLGAANLKFERRFRDMENAIIESGKSLKDLSIESLDEQWRAAKKRVG